jgi:phosphoenolpyruvate carboxykinase (diphosphate)
VLHNPASDRRTTEGSFHVAEGGLPIPGDKKAVPKAVFARLLEAALESARGPV